MAVCQGWEAWEGACQAWEEASLAWEDLEQCLEEWEEELVQEQEPGLELIQLLHLLGLLNHQHPLMIWIKLQIFPEQSHRVDTLARLRPSTIIPVIITQIVRNYFIDFVFVLALKQLPC